ncbi:MAG: ECF transporter S component [bacterium]
MKATRMLAYTGVGAALVTAATIVIQIPSPQTKGYINLGDTLIFTIAMLFGSKIGGLAGGIGSALADIITGYAHWAPFTLVIKGIEGFIVGYFAYNPESIYRKLPFLILAGLEMVIGYFLAEIILYGIGPALVEIPGNCFQAGSGIVISILIISALKRIKKA